LLLARLALQPLALLPILLPTTPLLLMALLPTLPPTTLTPLLLLALQPLAALVPRAGSRLRLTGVQ